MPRFPRGSTTLLQGLEYCKFSYMLDQEADSNVRLLTFSPPAKAKTKLL